MYPADKMILSAAISDATRENEFNVNMITRLNAGQMFDSLEND